MLTNDESGRFDLKRALARFAGDTELLGEAIAIFKEEAPKHLDRIKELLSGGSLQDIIGHAHTLKGECGAVGAVTAHFMSESLEKAAKNNDFSASKELFGQVEEEVRTAIDQLPDSTV
ncbi:Hpt domain-containing protein [Maridesulfovibrio sp. FT414]|uniref:Hpt domain-containing protein n=1 Tax=Maridesulfovibrio sp. FT414 TaxID=2979469 RepID=UPI003D804AA7